MDFKNIEYSVKEIKNLVKRNRIPEAIKSLENFIEKIDDEILSDDLIKLTARYNREKKEKVSGKKEGEIVENQIVDSFMFLLKEAKEIAFDKVTLKTGNQLEQLTSRGEKSIANLEKINLMIAKSRILELEVMTQGAAAVLLSPAHKERINNCIDSFNQLINELEKEE
jgi:hypothetical protein